MKPKIVLGIVLLVFAVGSLAYLVVSAALAPDGPPSPGPADAPAADGGPPDAVVVTYFLTNFRCPTCLKIEAYSREAVERGFAADVAAGRLYWRAVNTDQPANKHFVDDYQLFAKAVVVSRRRGGKEVAWKNLDQIWDLVGQKDVFLAYIRDEVSACLKEN